MRTSPPSCFASSTIPATFSKCALLVSDQATGLQLDWVDYQQRNSRIDPVAVARRALRAAGDRPVFVVFRDDFLTLEGKCAAFVAELGRSRPAEQLVGESEEYYEPMNVIAFRPT